jgi:hypothetical protein
VVTWGHVLKGTNMFGDDFVLQARFRFLGCIFHGQRDT